MTYHKRLFQEPEGSYFLLGPRGTGKSTWLKHQHPDALQIDLLDAVVFRTFAARPETLEEVVLAEVDKTTVIIDEIQRVPELLSVVHRLIELKLGKQFILTGSSARKLKRAGVDLLAGRALFRTLHPFMAIEIPEDFQLEKALVYGTLPLVMASKQPKDVLAAYAATYLQQEVQAEGIVRNIGEFARFLEVVAFSHGEMINVSNIAGECQVERKTVSSFLSVLEDLLLSFQLEIFTKRARRDLVSHPKFYLFDPGVFRSLRKKGPLDSTFELDGHALEGLVAAHLRAWIAYSSKECRLYYWRTRHGVEVDFILYGEEAFYAIEVKNSTNISHSDLKGLKSFQSDYPECQPLLLYRGKDKRMIDQILCLPVDSFLLKLDPKHPLNIPNHSGR
ncbi:ATP-binding protein [Chlamydiota bacterium]